MPDWFTNLLWVVLAIAAACYLLMPLAIKATQFLAAHPRYQAIEPSNLAADVVAFMAPTEAVLRQHGFYAVTLLRSAGDVPGVTADVMLFVHLNSGDTAQVVFTRGGPLTTPTVTLETAFADGYAIITTNFADAGTFPRNPTKHRLAIPRLTDVALLCEIHRRRRLSLAPPRLAPVVPPRGQEAEAQEREDAGRARASPPRAITLSIPTACATVRRSRARIS